MNRIVVISALVGFVAAGFVWFGWDLVENLTATFSRKKAAPAKDVKATKEK